MKKLVANLALLLVTLLAMFALCEGVVRLLLKDETVLFPRYHTDYQYGRYTLRGIRANSEYWQTSVDGSWKHVTNNRGFRDTRNFAYEKPAGTVRVLSLGDSHTQGYEVRQDATFSAVIERYLVRHGRAAEVINAGVSGYSNAEALALLENEGIKYKPDAVVVGFSGNDFDDNLKAGLFALEGDRLVEKKYEHLPGVRIQNVIYGIAPVRWLSENSYFYSVLFNSVWEFVKAQARASAMRQAAATPAEQAAADGPELAVQTAAATQYQIDLATALIERMHRFCQERGVRLIVVDLPRTGEPYSYTSPVPAAMIERFEAAGIEFIGADELLGKFNGVAEMHVPHGHRHISEFTHLMVGTEVGRRLLAPSGGSTAATR